MIDPDDDEPPDLRVWAVFVLLGIVFWVCVAGGCGLSLHLIVH